MTIKFMLLFDGTKNLIATKLRSQEYSEAIEESERYFTQILDYGGLYI